VQIGDHRDLLFLFDTGASASAIDLKTAERLQLSPTGTVKVEGTAGVIDAKTVKIPSLSVGEARVDNLSATAQDLSASLAPKAMRLDGILGYDFLSHCSVEINFKDHTIGFSKKPSRPALRTAVAVPFTLDHRIPRFKGILSGSIDADFRLDTGASLFETRDVYLNVTEATWRKLTDSDSRLVPEGHLKGSGPGGEVELPVARIKEFSLGELVIPKPYVIVQPKVGYFARPDAVGFISNNLLERYGPVAVDYLERKLYLGKSGTEK
jgi:hypothetical protein